MYIRFFGSHIFYFLYRTAISTQDALQRLYFLCFVKKAMFFFGCNFSIFYIVLLFPGRMHYKDSDLCDSWKNTVICQGATFLSFISHCYFQAECAPSDYSLYHVWKKTVHTENKNLVSQLKFYCRFRSCIFSFFFWNTVDI